MTGTLKKINIESLDKVIFHCEMFLYGFNRSAFMDNMERGDNIAERYNQFTGLHLISTMFLNKDYKDLKSQPIYGVCYRLLEPINLAHLLQPIQKILNKKIGSISFGKYIKETRNYLATHGTLDFDDLNVEVKKATSNYVNNFSHAMGELGDAVASLLEKLEEIRRNYAKI